MKNSIIFFFLLTTASFGNSLKISIQNKNLKGVTYLSIYRNSDSFLKPSKAFKNIKFELKDNSTSLVIEDIPQGEYAFTIFIDENNNGVLDTNIFKIPKEPSAFSNNYKPKFKPSFDSAKFSINKSAESIQNIILK
ncbi:DUF2141 domain-containing protein [Cetobacterium sp.]|uniref:DUF2141 domain-containing protein n=1 Tax=Cetobacterium sp. TaxID=2071632 RepID=UPI003F354A0D